jgi:hypothetical protein
MLFAVKPLSAFSGCKCPLAGASSTNKMEGEITMKTIKELRQAIENEPARSAWSRGVKEYAQELIAKRA